MLERVTISGSRKHGNMVQDHAFTPHLQPCTRFYRTIITMGSYGQDLQPVGMSLIVGYT